MKVIRSTFIIKYTVFDFGEPLPIYGYNKIVIDGIEYPLVPIYDAGECLAIRGNVDATGKEVRLI